MKLFVTGAAIKMLTVTAIEIGIVNLVIVCSKTSLVVFAIIFHQQCPTVTNNPGLLITKQWPPKINTKSAI
jgi:hypothetical protein